MKKRYLPTFGAFYLSFQLLLGCGIFKSSPFSDKEAVRVSGQIQTAEGQPYQGRVKVVTARETYSPETDTQGRFRLDLLGFETKGGLDQAIEIQFSASHPDGSEVSQSKALFKSEQELPPMRFWNGLSSPPNNHTLNKAVPIGFGWEIAPNPDARYLEFQVSVRHARIGTIWSEKTQNGFPSRPLPLELLENQSSYTWDVTAVYPEYRAKSSVRSFRTGDLHTVLPIQSVQIAGQNKPPFFDGFYQSELKDSLDLNPDQPIDVSVDLGKSQSLGTLVLASTGFSANLKIFAGERPEKTSTPLIQEAINDYQVMTFPEGTKARYIVLELSGRGGFRSIQEIRVLAPKP
ncbi:MAG: hypothetical protein AB7I41_02495 [Candidatus Sericytochromatia bacterium]